MLQVLQSLRTGEVRVVDVPCPRPAPGYVLVRSRKSLISAGTERMLLEFGRASLFEKARLQPDRVRQVVDKIRTDGLAATWESVSARLDEPLPLGYSNAGVILDVGSGVTGLAPGDRVVSNGPHAEFVQVPRNLVARIPDDVSDGDAAFAVLASIALQGVRLAQPTLGERFVVIGLGLVGLLAVQMLRANGCRVLAIDLDSRKLGLARQFGAQVVDVSGGADPLQAAEAFSDGCGVDGVLIAAATKSSAPVHQAAVMCRKRGRIVLIGVTGLRLLRDDFYRKELTFQVSCSYGPGRYDPAYEQGGQDYPAGFVRWTAQRNFEAALEMMASGRLEVKPLITHTFPVQRSAEAYALLQGAAPYLGVMLEYPENADATHTVALSPPNPPAPAVDNVSVGFIGAGNYAARTLMPAFKGAGAGMMAVVSATGVTAANAGRKFGFQHAGTEADCILGNPAVTAAVIATRHDSHAEFVCRALRAGKHVFVEKPLALRTAELDEIESVYRSLDRRPVLMVGFNRRFAPQVRAMKDLLGRIENPKVFVMTVNAGSIPAAHWVHDPNVGGGRILGEACHFIDLLRFLAGAPIASARILTAGCRREPRDTASISLAFADGSLGTVHYLSNGPRVVPKERLEIFCAGRWLSLDNFRRLSGHGWPGFRRLNLWRQDKGNAAAVSAFLEAVRHGQPSPIPFEELMEVSRTAIELGEAAANAPSMLAATARA